MITKFKKYNFKGKSAEERFLLDWQKVPEDEQQKLPYKVGDYIELHTTNFGGAPTGNPTLDIYGNFEIIYVRYVSVKENNVKKITYGIKDIGDDDEEYFETSPKYIIRKVPEIEIEANKYNI